MAKQKTGATKKYVQLLFYEEGITLDYLNPFYSPIY